MLVTRLVSRLLCAGAMLATCSAQAVKPPAKGEEIPHTVSVLGPQIMNAPFTGVSRDGGSGGYINGKHLIVFSDTENYTISCYTVTNSIAYSSPLNPRFLQDFGTNGCPRQGVPYIPEEQTYTNNGKGLTRVVIWPQGAIVPIASDSRKGFGIGPVSIQSAPGAPPGGPKYSTLYTVTANADGPVVERTVPKLWLPTQVQYGTFNTFLGKDGYVYFVAAEGVYGTPNAGLKLARATWSTYLDKTRWQFWTGTSWVSTPPAINAAKPFVSGWYSSGTVFFSNYFGTYVVVYFNAFVDSTFRYRYAVPDANGQISLTGTWSKEYVLYDSNPLKDPKGGYKFNYAGHAYPSYDTSGKTLVLSFSRNDGITPYFLLATFNRPGY